MHGPDELEVELRENGGDSSVVEVGVNNSCSEAFDPCLLFANDQDDFGFRERLYKLLRETDRGNICDCSVAPE